MRKCKTIVVLSIIIFSILMFLGANNTSNGYAFFDSTTINDSSINIGISAKFKQSSVFFDSNGGTSVNTLTGYTYDSLNQPAIPTKTHYDFLGWYSDSAFNNEFDFIEYGFDNITLYAKWTLSSYTITFDTRGGSAINSKTQIYLTNVTAPSNPTRTGFDFLGWYSDSNRTQYYQFSTMPGENITLYAEWGTTGLVYSSFNGGYSVSGGSDKTLTNIVIPNSYFGSPILKINNDAFKNFSNLESINIPSTVQEIGGSAFQRCGKLTQLFIPLSVKKIGYYVFHYCGSLTIYTEASKAPSGWAAGVWSVGSKKVVWGTA